MAIVAKAAVRLQWPQEQQVPLGGAYRAYRDNRDGQIDYDAAVNAKPLPAWPEGEGKMGFGLGAFGACPFGFEGGLGFGLGAFGSGPFGFESGPMQYVTAPLDDGTWKFAVVGFDAAGNGLVPSSVTASATIAGVPLPPGVPQIVQYDAQSDCLTVQWTLSPDDEG